LVRAFRRHSLLADSQRGRALSNEGNRMGRIESFRAYATDCMRRAEGEQTPEDRTILLNIALAWVRLAQQSQDAARAAGQTAAAPQGAAASDQAAPPAH
jgi:hypothetical protein